MMRRRCRHPVPHGVRQGPCGRGRPRGSHRAALPAGPAIAVTAPVGPG